MFRLFVSFFVIFSINCGAAKLKLDIKSSGQNKKSYFSIITTFSELESLVFKKLLSSGRFKKTPAPSSISGAKSLGLDLLLILKKKKDVFEVKVIDVMQGKEIKFNVSDEGTLNQVANALCDKVYSLWFKEPGIFSSSILYAKEIGKNLFRFAETSIDGSLSKVLSPPISYLTTFSVWNGKILFTKFSSKSRGFAVFTYDVQKNEFIRLVSIKNASVFAPVISAGEAFVSVAYKGTTSIYSLSLAKKTNFKSFDEFEKFNGVTKVTGRKGRIATSPSIYKDNFVFCANYLWRAKIFKLPNEKIVSSDAAYYDPVLFKNQKIGMVKVNKGLFTLSILDLASSLETDLDSNYFVSKPSWSDCGNWVVASSRAMGKRNVLNIYHVASGFKSKIEINHPARLPVWINSSIVREV